MKAWIGKAIVVIGIIHSMVGVLFSRSTLALLWSEGLINTVDGQPEREFAFWFLAFGLLTIILGSFIDWAERNGIIAPPFLGWCLFVLTAVLVTIMPLSGGWLVFVPAIGLIYRSRKKRS